MQRHVQRLRDIHGREHAAAMLCQREHRLLLGEALFLGAALAQALAAVDQGQASMPDKSAMITPSTQPTTPAGKMAWKSAPTIAPPPSRCHGDPANTLATEPPTLAGCPAVLTPVPVSGMRGLPHAVQ